MFTYALQFSVKLEDNSMIAGQTPVESRRTTQRSGVKPGNGHVEDESMGFESELKYEG